MRRWPAGRSSSRPRGWSWPWCGPEAAINELKIVSQRTNVKLQVLATVLTTAVDQRSVLDAQDPVAVKIVLTNWPSVSSPPTGPAAGSDAQHAW